MTNTLTDPTRTPPQGRTETAPTAEITNCQAPSLEGFLAWLPALVILIGMPLLALGTSKYVLVPKMKQIYAQEMAAGQEAAPLLAKIPLNIPGVKGMSSGFRSLGLICADNACKEKVEQNKARITTLACNDLKGKTASDLCQAGVLDATRGLLLADIDRALGGPVVKEVYIAVWPPR
ncbi:MAG: hypothetical protein ABSA83_02340 [Verrucomicrobiota bacterium]|jgi:hypothetical protein